MVYGCRTLNSDRGAAFRSTLEKSMCKMLGVNQVFTSSRHPQTNSRCEAYNKNILNSLRTHCGSVDNWPSLLPEIGHAFRTSVLKQIDYTPFEVVFGQKPRLPIDETLLPPTSLPTNAKSYFNKMESKLRILRETVRRYQIEAHKQTAKIHDAKYTVKEPKFCVGDRVYLLKNPKSKIKHAHKMLKKFQGPYLILNSYPNFRTYKIQHCETKKVHPSLIHADRLRLCDDNREKLYSRHFVPGTEVETGLKHDQRNQAANAADLAVHRKSRTDEQIDNKFDCKTDQQSAKPVGSEAAGQHLSHRRLLSSRREGMTEERNTTPTSQSASQTMLRATEQQTKKETKAAVQQKKLFRHELFYRRRSLR